jgi:hypothetical protein
MFREASKTFFKSLACVLMAEEDGTFLYLQVVPHEVN